MFELLPFDRRQRNMMRYFDELERDLWRGFSASAPTAEFRTDILDEGDHYLLQAELPGFAREDIHVDLTGDRLEIRAEQKSEREEKEEQYIRKERRQGSYTRRFTLNGIRNEEITASYRDGVLELKLPKKLPEEPAARSIEIA